MNMRCWSVLFLVLLLAVPSRGNQPLSVLFVGNSYTFRNDLPQVFRQVVAGTGQAEPRVTSRALGGKTLGWYCTDAGLAAKLTEHFDVVILQEQSLVPAIAEVDLKLRQGFLLSSSLLAQQIRERNPGVRIIFFQTWARASWFWESAEVDRRAGSSADDMQDRLSRWYAEAARGSGGTVAPVGEAWRTHLRDRKAVGLHDKDGSHPAWAGTYLAALVLAKTVYGPTLETRFVGRLKTNTAQHLMNIATTAVAAEAKGQVQAPAGGE